MGGGEGNVPHKINIRVPASVGMGLVVVLAYLKTSILLMTHDVRIAHYDGRGVFRRAFGHTFGGNALVYNKASNTSQTRTSKSQGAYI